jgi:hypothetical protein
MDGSAMFAPLSPEEAVKASPAPKQVKIPIVPVPDDATKQSFKHPKLGFPSKEWPYHDAEGRLVGYVLRWDLIGDDGTSTKEVMPVTYCDLGKGKRGWRSKGIPAPRPLFALPEILARTDAPVLICEGEKTRDAAAVLFPDMVATTPAHGAKSPHLTDFGPCSGRIVVIATDYDEPGRKDDRGRPLHPGQDFGDKVHELARRAGAAKVLHLHPERLGAWVWRDGERVLRGESLPDGWDLADALEEGWTTERVAELQTDPAFLAPYLDAQAREETRAILEGGASYTNEPEGWPFRLAWNGVEKRVERTDKETGFVTVEWRWFCSLLEVIADTRSSEGEEWGRLLQITDRDSRVKQWAMPMAMLAGDGQAYRERLLSLGLILSPGRFAKEALHEYVSTARPEVKARCVSRIGWQGKAFVGFTENFGESDE